MVTNISVQAKEEALWRVAPMMLLAMTRLSLTKSKEAVRHPIKLM